MRTPNQFTRAGLHMSVAFVALMAGLGPVEAMGQTSGETTSTEGEIVVTGYAGQLQSARDAKRGAQAITDSVTSDDVGSLPDYGLGEALVRVPGVTTIINNGRGEAQLFTLRGLNADYNAVEVDGFSLPATETSRRNVSLDVIPSSLAKRVDVYKSMNTSQTGNAIGGLANLITRTAFDHEGLFIGGRADLSEWTDARQIRSRTPSGDAELIVSSRFGADKNWGFVIDASYYRRDSSSWNSAVDTYSYVDPATGKNLDKASAASSLDTAYAVPDRQRWLYYDNLRQRGGVFAKLEYQGGNFSAYLTGAAFKHKNDEARESNILIGGSTSVGAAPATNVTAQTGSVASGSAQVDLAHYVQNRTISYVQSGIDWRPGEKSHLTAAVNYAVSTYRQDAALYTYKTAASSGFGYSYTYDTGDFPVFAPTNANTLYNPKLYQQIEKTNTVDHNRERVFAFKTDYSFNGDATDQGLGFNAGADVRLLKRDYTFTSTSFAPLTPANFTLADILSTTTVMPYNGAGRHLLLIDEDAAASVYAANSAAFKDKTSATANFGSNYTVDENIVAGYLMGRYARGPLNATFGVRYEHTDLTTGSYQNSSTKLSPTPVFTWTETNKDYGRLLPSAYVSYDVGPAIKVRAAFSQTIGRPNYDKIAARTVEVVDASSGTATVSQGNPNLKPRSSDNYDLSFEFYPTRSVQLSAGLFHKDIRNEIITTSSTATELVNGVNTVVTTTQPVNASNLSVNGVELALVVPHFKFLPGLLSGFGGSVNATFLDQHPNMIVMKDGSIRRLPALVEAAGQTVNASLIYDYGIFGARLAYNHTSKILWTVATDSIVNDLYYAPTDTFDLQTTLRVAPGLTIVAQAKNFTNERNRRMFGLHRELLREELDNGRSYWIGAKFTF